VIVNHYLMRNCQLMLKLVVRSDKLQRLINCLEGYVLAFFDLKISHGFCRKRDAQAVVR
jgi:hypothetical protein